MPRRKMATEPLLGESVNGNLLPMSHRALQRYRLRKIRGRANPERVYAAAWLRITSRRKDYLAFILGPKCDPVPYTRRDAEVAASVIQWLGTNVGLGFIIECEKKIDAMRRKAEDVRMRDNLIAEQRRQRADEAAHAEAVRIAVSARARRRFTL